MFSFIALCRREIATLFLAPSLYVMAAFFVLLYSYMFRLIVLAQQIADFGQTALVIVLLLTFMIPLITMRAFAEETASGTIELLLTAPIRCWAVVAAKFTSALAFCSAIISTCTVHILLLDYCGDIDVGATITSMLALFLLGMLFTSIGIFTSCLTDSQIVAAALALGLNFMLLFLGYSAEGVSGLLGYVSYMPHFKRLLSGVVDTRDLVYFFSLSLTFLLLTLLVIESRGLISRGRASINRRWEFAAGILFGLGIISVIYGVCVLYIAGNLLRLDYYLPALLRQDRSSIFPWLFSFSLAIIMFLFAALALGYARGKGSTGNRFSPFKYISGTIATLLSTRVLPAILASIGIIVILVNLNYLAAYPFSNFQNEPALSLLTPLQWRNWDCSDTDINTLSIETRNTLDELTEQVDIHVFFSGREPYKKVPVLDETRALLNRYVNYSPLIRVRFIDSYDSPEEAIEIAKSMGELPIEKLAQISTIEYKGRRLIVPAEALLKPPTWQEHVAGKKEYKYNGEFGYTLALRRLLDPRRVNIYFSSAHGEFELTSSTDQKISLYLFAKTLKQRNFSIRKILLREDENIPLDCDILILGGGRLPYGKKVIASIRRYTDRGGRVLVLMHRSTKANPHGFGKPLVPDPDLETLVKSWGGVIQSDSIIDRQYNDSGQINHIRARGSQQHPICQSGRNTQCFLPYARSFREDPEVDPWQMTRLLESSENSVSIFPTSDNKVRPRRGPHAVAFASARPGHGAVGEARAVVIGSVEMANNLNFDRAHNASFLISTIHWLAGRDYRISIEPAGFIDRSVTLTGEKIRVIECVAVIALPAVWLLLAGLVWWMRKQ